MSSGKFFWGVLAGVAAGAILGVLLAPDKGSETRRKLIETGEDYADTVKEKFNQMVDSMSEKFEHVKDDMDAKTRGARKDVESAMM
ncbi:MAG: YtxH domain-containing protein [Methanosarcina sp.]